MHVAASACTPSQQASRPMQRSFTSLQTGDIQAVSCGSMHRRDLNSCRCLLSLAEPPASIGYPLMCMPDRSLGQPALIQCLLM
jgi:hypothetical protein